MDPVVGDLRTGDILIEATASSPSARTSRRPMRSASTCVTRSCCPASSTRTGTPGRPACATRYADIDPAIYFKEMLGTKGAAFGPEDVYVGTLLGAVSAIDSGITTMLDWSHVQNSDEHADAAIRGPAGRRHPGRLCPWLATGRRRIVDVRQHAGASPGHPTPANAVLLVGRPVADPCHGRLAVPRWRGKKHGSPTCEPRASSASARRSTWAPMPATPCERSRGCTKRAHLGEDLTFSALLPLR